MNYKRAFYIVLVAFVMVVCCSAAFSYGLHVGEGTLSDVCDSIDNVATKLGYIDSELDSIEEQLSSIADEVGNVWRYR